MNVSKESMSPRATSGERVRVVMLVPSLVVGGAERDIVRVAPRIDRSRFEVIVGVFSEAGPLVTELRDAGIEVVVRQEVDAREPDETGTRRRGIGGAMGLASRTLGVVSWMGRLLAQRDASIAHFFLPHTYAYGMVAHDLYARRTRTVMSRLSLNYYGESLPTLTWFERRYHKRVDRAVGNSAAILEELEAEGVPPERLRFIPNGLDTSLFVRDEVTRAQAREEFGARSDAFVMVAVGNLHEHKGHDDLLAALEYASPQLPGEWLLLIAGRDVDDRRQMLETQASERGLGGHVRFLGEIRDVPALLSAGDVFVHPSHHEGLPNAVLEAMAASLPVVATHVGGIDQVIGQDAEAIGVVVPPQEPAALGEALVAISQDAEGRRRMGELAQRRAESDYSIEACVAAYERLYSELT